MAAPEGYNALGKIGLSYKGEYDSNTVYERLDAVYHSGSTYLALKDAPAGAPSSDGTNWMYLAKGVPSDIGESEIAFEEAAARENIDTGESIKTVFGKIKKWFADMTAAAFAQIITSNTDLMANMVSGYLVDALAVKNQFEAVEATKADKNGSESLKATKDVLLDGYSFINAPFVAQTSNNAQTPAGYGFHNAGSVGMFLYMNRADANLRAHYNDNTDYALFTEKNMVAENVTADFVATNLISFTALKYGNEIRIFFVGDTTKDFSLVTTKWKPKFPTEYLCLNYSAWNNAAGYQGVVSRIAKIDGTIAEYKASEGLLYAYMTPLCFIYYI